MISLQSQGFLNIDGTSLEYRWIEPRTANLPTLVFLHEGLGCVGMWKDFPDRVAETTGCGTLVYSRAGYGASGPVELPRPVLYMHHHEGLEVLPELIKKAGFEKIILIGHSDGGSISLVYAGSDYASNLCGLVLMAPHVFSEDVCVESVHALETAYRTTNLPEKLARYHGAQTDAAFWGWHDIWAHPEFWYWNLEKYLPAIEVPVLVMQGKDDQYGTLRQIETIKNHVSSPCTMMALPDCGHSPHIDQEVAVHTAITDFIHQIVQ